MSLSSLICLLVLSCCGVYCHAVVARAEFESCPACRLNALPQVKRFLFKVVQKGAYGPKVTVKWLHGRTPELVLYDEQDKEIERMFIDKLTFNDLHTLLQQKGFRPLSDRSDDSQSKDKPQLATVLQQPSHEGASDASATPKDVASARRALRGHSVASSWLRTLTQFSITRSLDLDA